MLTWKDAQGMFLSGKPGNAVQMDHMNYVLHDRCAKTLCLTEIPNKEKLLDTMLIQGRKIRVICGEESQKKQMNK